MYVNMICNFFLISGQSITGATTECIILNISFQSFAAVAKLLEDYKNGTLTNHFRPIQDAVRCISGYEEYTLTVDITFDAYMSFLAELGKIFLSRKKHYK